jgi:hypothetical protein
MAKTLKGKDSKIARLEETLKRLRDREKKRVAAGKARAASRRYDKATWKGPAPAPLGVYYIRVMLDEQQVGGFGPYATVRAAAADAKNILRMHIGPGHKIVQTGPVVPVIRSDKEIRLYLHPESYSAQLAGKGIISAQVIETEPPESRLDTFPFEYGESANSNPRRRRPRATAARRTRNPAYGSDMDESKKVVVEGVKGMRSTPFRKTFRNFAAYLKWTDSDAASNCSVYRVYNE